MSTLQNSRNASEIELQLSQVTEKMGEHQARGEYM